MYFEAHERADSPPHVDRYEDGYPQGNIPCADFRVLHDLWMIAQARSDGSSIRIRTQKRRRGTLERLPVELVENNELEPPVEHAHFLQPDEIHGRLLVLEEEAPQEDERKDDHGSDGVGEDEVARQRGNEVRHGNRYASLRTPSATCVAHEPQNAHVAEEASCVGVESDHRVVDGGRHEGKEDGERQPGDRLGEVVGVHAIES